MAQPRNKSVSKQCRVFSLSISHLLRNENNNNKSSSSPVQSVASSTHQASKLGDFESQQPPGASKVRPRSTSGARASFASFARMRSPKVMQTRSAARSAKAASKAPSPPSSPSTESTSDLSISSRNSRKRKRNIMSDTINETIELTDLDLRNRRIIRLSPKSSVGDFAKLNSFSPTKKEIENCELTSNGTIPRISKMVSVKNGNQNNLDITWRKSILMIGATLACCLNMFFQEQILRLSPNSSNFISFVQHIFISLIGILILFVLPAIRGASSSKWSSIPFYYYLPLVLLSFVAIVSNNLALNFGVSIPLQMIFRSSSLIANMFLGTILLSHRYSIRKYLSIIAITVGLWVCSQEEYRVKLMKPDLKSSTILPVLDSVGSDNLAPTGCCSSDDFSIENLLNFLRSFAAILQPFELFNSITANLENQTIIGIGLMLISLILSAGIGIYQEYLSKSFGKFYNESLFYVHLFSLPMFVTLLSDLHRNLVEFSQSTPVSAQLEIGHLWFYLAATVLSQYCCIWSVYRLTTECASLTVTLCVTNRKFLSLLISIFYFANHFTVVHWFGTALVFAGTLAFTVCDSINFSSFRRVLNSHKFLKLD